MLAIPQINCTNSVSSMWWYSQQCFQAHTFEGCVEEHKLTSGCLLLYPGPNCQKQNSILISFGHQLERVKEALNLVKLEGLVARSPCTFAFAIEQGCQPFLMMLSFKGKTVFNSKHCNEKTNKKQNPLKETNETKFVWLNDTKGLGCFVQELFSLTNQSFVSWFP